MSNQTARPVVRLGVGGEARLRIFDVSGRLVTTLLDESRNAGSHLVRWEGRDDRGRQRQHQHKEDCKALQGHFS